ncbi:prepilin-type N-terminal cleavage/methylation domain-containing protein [bacterium]|nr:MAG: prepilin-type N-terminal cleavage/methylation domain-containing protein [bacterium]
MAGLKRAPGFTLVELMLATLIFSMVIAGLAAIYTTAFSQSGAVLRDARLKTTAMVAFKGMTQNLVSATRLDSPPKGGSGNVLRGCTNMAPDGVQNTAAVAFGSFGYCVQPGAVGTCGTPEAPAPCLYQYNWANICPSPVLSNGNCGSTVGGAVPEFVASRVMVPASIPNYFVRTTAMAAGNQVHIGMVFQRDATGKIPVMQYEVQTVANTQFDARL